MTRNGSRELSAEDAERLGLSVCRRFRRGRRIRGADVGVLENTARLAAWSAWQRLDCSRPRDMQVGFICQSVHGALKNHCRDEMFPLVASPRRFRDRGECVFQVIGFEDAGVEPTAPDFASVVDSDLCVVALLHKLTPRERDVLQGRLDGRTNAEIGRRLCLSIGQVNYAHRSIAQKYDNVLRGNGKGKYRDYATIRSEIMGRGAAQSHTGKRTAQS